MTIDIASSSSRGSPMLAETHKCCTIIRCIGVNNAEYLKIQYVLEYNSWMSGCQSTKIQSRILKGYQYLFLYSLLLVLYHCTRANSATSDL
jgi:hypothetical protein